MKKGLLILGLFFVGMHAFASGFTGLNSMVTPLPVSNAGARSGSGKVAENAEALKVQAAIMFLEDMAYRKLFGLLDKDYNKCLKNKKNTVWVLEGKSAQSWLGSLSESVAKNLTDGYLWGAADLYDLKVETDRLRKDKNNDSSIYQYTNPKMSVKDIGKYPEIRIITTEGTPVTGVKPIDNPSPRMKSAVQKMKASKQNETDLDGKKKKFTKKDEIITIIEPFIMVMDGVDTITKQRELNKRDWFKQQNAVVSEAMALYLKVELQRLQKLFDLVSNFDTLNDGTSYDQKRPELAYKVPTNDWNEDLVINAQLWNIFNRLLLLHQQIKTARLGIKAGAGVTDADPVYESVISDDKKSGWEKQSVASSSVKAGDILYGNPEWDLELADGPLSGGVPSGDIDGEIGDAGDHVEGTEETETECTAYISICFAGYDLNDISNLELNGPNLQLKGNDLRLSQQKSCLCTTVEVGCDADYSLKGDFFGTQGALDTSISITDEDAENCFWQNNEAECRQCF